MKKIVSFICLTATMASQAQNTKPVTDYLGVPGAITFQAQAYSLVWTSHPSATYYKQEYIPKGDTVERFKTMLLLEALTGTVKPADAAAAKLAELKGMKESNPAVQYENLSNSKTGEYMIHFVLTASGADGKVAVAEQNVYRYQTFTGSKGKTGLLLFGISKRAYGAAVPAFLAGIKNSKAALVAGLAKATVPAVAVKD